MDLELKHTKKSKTKTVGEKSNYKKNQQPKIPD